MAHLFSKMMTLIGEQILIDCDMQFGLQLVANPTETHIMDILYLWNATRCPLHRLDHLRVHGIHKTTPHGHGGILDNKQDGKGDQHANDRVSERKPEETSHSPNEHRKRGQSIHPRMLAVSYKCRRPDLTPDTHAQDCYPFIAHKPDDGGGHHPPDIAERLWMEKLLIALVSSHQRTRENDQDNDDASDILRTPIPIGVTAVGRSKGQCEGDPERNSGEGIRKVMDGIRQQAHTATQQGNQQLKQGRHAQCHERDFECPDAPIARLHRFVDLDLAVTVSVEERNDLDEPPEATMSVLMIVVRIFRVLVLLMGMLMRSRVIVCVHTIVSPFTCCMLRLISPQAACRLGSRDFHKLWLAWLPTLLRKQVVSTPILSEAAMNDYSFDVPFFRLGGCDGLARHAPRNTFSSME